MTDNLNISVQLDNCTLTIKYPEVTYPYWKSLLPYYNDSDLCIILENLFISLDCSITYEYMRIIMTSHMNYELYIGRYYYYLLHMEDQYLYNQYFNILLKLHEDNIQFELNNPIIEKVVQTKSRDFTKIKAKPKFIKQTTTDLITSKEVYKYINVKTGEIITSEDPDLLNALNSKPKKEKKEKSVGIPMTMMTFSFKKK